MKNITPAILFLFIYHITFGHKEKKLHEIMKTYYQYNMFNGVNQVAENGNLIYKHVFGLANRK